MSIGSKLSNYRRAMNLTQEEVAKKIHVSRATISSWEVGRTSPDIEKLIVLSTLYNFSLDQLIKEEYNIMEQVKTERKRLKRYKGLKLVFICIVSLFIIYNIYWFTTIYPKNKNLETWEHTSANNYLKKDEYHFQAHKLSYTEPLFARNNIEVSTYRGFHFFMSMDSNFIHLLAYFPEKKPTSENIDMNIKIDKTEFINSDFKLNEEKLKDLKDTEIAELVNSHSKELELEYKELESIWNTVNNK